MKAPFLKFLLLPLAVSLAVTGGLPAQSATAQGEVAEDALLLLTRETSPETLAAQSPASTPLLVKRILARVHNLRVVERLSIEDSLDSALYRNRTPLARREAMKVYFSNLYQQATNAGLFTGANAKWFSSAGAVPAGTPELARILPLEGYPEYAREVINFSLVPVSDLERSNALAVISALPPPGSKIAPDTVVSAAPAPAAQTTAPPAEYQYQSQETVQQTRQGPIISGSSTAAVGTSAFGGVEYTRSYTTPYGEVEEDRVSGGVSYRPYPPAYYYPAPPVYYPPPVYPRPPKEPKPRVQVSTSTYVVPNTGEEEE